MIGMLSRQNNEVIIAPSSHVGSKDIIKRVVKKIEPDATIYHDDYSSYGILDGLYEHESVNHSAGEYVRDGDAHTNTIEAEFSVLRPWLDTYRGVSKEKLYLYCSQYQFLRRTRTMNRVSRAIASLGFDHYGGYSKVLIPEVNPPALNH